MISAVLELTGDSQTGWLGFETKVGLPFWDQILTWTTGRPRRTW